MVYFSLSSLLDLSGIRVAYLMWTRHDISKYWSDVRKWHNLEQIIIAEVKRLPIAEQIKRPILKLVKPAGEHLFLLLSIWLLKTQPMKANKWLPANMFFDCLVLNGLGLIDHRKTAEKVLSNRMLHNIFAFRLACINFLEMEVLELWPEVKQYFLNQLTLQGKNSLKIKELSGAVDCCRCTSVHPSIDVEAYFNCDCDYLLTNTKESHEILFWISWCLSVENATDFQATPQCIERSVWEKLILHTAFSSGNFACLQFYKKYSKKAIICKYENLLEKYWFYNRGNYRTSFVYFYMTLNSKARLELFKEWPRETMLRFFHWPLSLTFTEKTEEIWNLICDGEKKWVILKLFSFLFERNGTMIRLILDSPGISLGNKINSLFLRKPKLLIKDHLMRIFGNLWKISSTSLKTRVLNTCVFANNRRRHHRFRSFQWCSESSELKKKLLELFLSKQEAVLKLSEGRHLRDSLRKIVHEYWQQYFKDLDEKCFSFLYEQCSNTEKQLLPFDILIDKGTYRIILEYEIEESFLDYVKDYLILTNTTNSSFFYH